SVCTTSAQHQIDAASRRRPCQIHQSRDVQTSRRGKLRGLQQKAPQPRELHSPCALSSVEGRLCARYVRQGWRNTGFWPFDRTKITPASLVEKSIAKAEADAVEADSLPIPADLLAICPMPSQASSIVFTRSWRRKARASERADPRVTIGH